METTTNALNFKQILNIFDKIYANLQKEHLAIFENEMQKLIPTQTSEVFLSVGADYNENSINIGVYVSNPKQITEGETMPLNRIIREWLFSTSLEEIKNLGDCLLKMEKQGIDKYDVDFIPIEFNDLINQYTTNFCIKREL